ncbi:MAG: tRNA pseudouridine(13) synthase TruD [Candidatus Omnitrophica bacterium]|nr:tRNA pseudouridine(13) synthase TruD [Candidatus Omnitrophota bacterium]
MKIKARPEDFIVEEILAVQPLDRGPFTLLRAKKRGLNTSDAVREIAAVLRKPLRDIAYGGRKDKHACATQFITVKGKTACRLPQRTALHTEIAGYLDRPMGPDLIAGNTFNITVRDLNKEEIDVSSQGLKAVSRDGFLNYFDNQRFGPFDPLQGFLGEKIVKKHFNGALKFYLTHAGSEDGKEDLCRKQFFFEKWGDWAACLAASATPWEQQCFSHLSSHPKDFVFILRRIPSRELAFHFASFQAFLWNEILRRMVRRATQQTILYPGLAGDYVFAEESLAIENTSIPTPSARMDLKDPQIDREYRRLFEERTLKTSHFNLTKIRQAYFKSVERPAAVKPLNLAFAFENDETSKAKNKMTLVFTLPRGAYATMLIKRLFARHGHLAA